MIDFCLCNVMFVSLSSNLRWSPITLTIRPFIRPYRITLHDEYRMITTYTILM
jgi:hypothetical protein